MFGIRKIEKLREKMHKSIEENGIDSVETRELSLKIDNLINKYYQDLQEQKQYLKNSEMYQFYIDSYKELEKVTLEFGEFPKSEDWNHYAKQNGYMTSISMEYISNLN